jgi:protein-S-isoprenylcysteine O-methyltransferase Ste14
VIFGTAGTWRYWQGWLFLTVFTASTTAFTVYLAYNDRALLERRLKGGPQFEKEPAQKIIVSLVIVAFFAFIIVPVLDYRHGWSRVPGWAAIAGDAIIVLSFVAIFRVIQINSYAASNISVEAGQRVIDSGPYARVRHPMYAAAIWLFVGMPLAFGSWRPIGLVILVLPVLIWRLLDEERVLRRDLAGYVDYTRRVPYRLIRGLW